MMNESPRPAKKNVAIGLVLLAAGGAIAPLLYYLAGSLALAAYLCSSRSLLTRSIAKVKLRWHLFRDILRIGLMGSVSTVATNLSIGLAAAAFPHAWLSLFGADPAMLEAGTLYLRTVGPLYGFFGVGLVLYFASQGGGRLLWPVAGNIARLAVAAIGGWLAIRWGGGLAQVFMAQAATLAVYGSVVAVAIAGGAWFGRVGWPCRTTSLLKRLPPANMNPT